MAASVSVAVSVSGEFPGRPPGNENEVDTNQVCSSANQMTSTVNDDGSNLKGKPKNRDNQSTVTPQSKGKRKPDTTVGHDDLTTDPNLEKLCRKKFKPIAPKPTVKKDHHQSVVTATLPIKEGPSPEMKSLLCAAPNNDRENNGVVFMSPKVQLITGRQIVPHCLHCDALSSPHSVTVPFLPHGKYLNVLAPPTGIITTPRVTMTDTDNNKTVVQLLPNCIGNCHLQPSGRLSLNSTGNPTSTTNDTSSSKSKPPNGFTADKSVNSASKRKSAPKSKSASRYKYSLLMNGGCYNNKALRNTAVENTKLQSNPPLSSNGAVRLNLPAVLTSTGVLQITVPSVGINNGQVQFCDVNSPAVVSILTSQCPTLTKQSDPPPSNVGENLTAQSNGNTTSGSISQTHTSNTGTFNTNGLSLDETLRAMLRSPKTTASQPSTQSTWLSKTNKQHKTRAVKNKTKAQTNVSSSTVTVCSVTANTNPVVCVSSPLISTQASEPRCGEEGVDRQNMQDGSTATVESTQTQPSHQEVVVSQLTPGTGLTDFRQVVKEGSAICALTKTTQTTVISGPTNQLGETSTTVNVPRGIDSQVTNMSGLTPQTLSQSLPYGQQSLPTDNLPCITAPRATSLPNFASATSNQPVRLTAPNPPVTSQVSRWTAESNITVPPIDVNQRSDISSTHRSTARCMQSENCIPTTFNVANYITTSPSLPPRSTYSASNSILRNEQNNLYMGSASILGSNQHLYPSSSNQSLPISREHVRPLPPLHQKQNASLSDQNAISSYSPPILNSAGNSSISDRPVSSVQIGRDFPEVSRSREASVESEHAVSSIRSGASAATNRRQIQHSNGIMNNLNPVIDSEPDIICPSRPVAMPVSITRSTDPESLVQMQRSIGNPMSGLNDLQTVSSINTNVAEKGLFIPHLPVVPHHSGILATAILRSRALEGNPWGIPPSLNTSTESSAILNTGSVATAMVPNNRGILPSSMCDTSASNVLDGRAVRSRHCTDQVLHLRPPSMPGFFGGLDKDPQMWPSPVGVTTSRQNMSSLQGNLLTQSEGDRHIRIPEAQSISFMQQQQPISTTSVDNRSLEAARIQSVPLHSNLPASARNVMNEALQRGTTTLPRAQPLMSTTSSSAVESTSIHTSAGLAAPECTLSNGNFTSRFSVTQLGTGRQEIPTDNTEHLTQGQPRPELMPHQYTSHHIHTMSGNRLASDSVSHLPMPLMPPPPSMLYGNSTPVPNLPVHGVPLPGALSSHSLQGHSSAHQLCATPPPPLHLGQPPSNTQTPVNHMFVSTPYGPIHRSLYMPPPSPHPPDLSLMSPRSFGQVHMHDSVLYSPRFSSMRNMPPTEGLFGSTLPRSLSEDQLDTCCSGPYPHSPPVHDNTATHLFPSGFMSPSMNRSHQQANLCNTLQRQFSHQSHQNVSERLSSPFFHDAIRHPHSHQLQSSTVKPASCLHSATSTTTTITACGPSESGVHQVNPCNSTQQANNSLLVVNTASPASSTSATTPGSLTSPGESFPPTPGASSTNSTPTRVYNMGSASDKYLPIELVVSSSQSSTTLVTTPTVSVSLASQLTSDQVVKFADVALECSRQILRESGRTVLCCWGCDYHTAEPKKMYRHQRRDEHSMKCQLCSHVGESRCLMNQHFKEVHMDKDEDPFRSSAVT